MPVSHQFKPALSDHALLTNDLKQQERKSRLFPVGFSARFVPHPVLVCSPLDTFSLALVAQPFVNPQ